MDYVGYYRVSTKAQGRSGLGLDAQTRVVRRFSEEHGTLIGEFSDVESGKNNDRVGLIKALSLARKSKATLLVAKLDRFSRKVSFISWLMEQRVELTVVEMPNASTFQLHIHAALAEEERRMISNRTKEALKAAKLRGVKLGTSSAQLSKANHKAAVEFANEIFCHHIPDNLRDSGLTAMANHLNSKKIKSYRGGKFYPSTISNMVRLLNSH